MKIDSVRDNLDIFFMPNFVTSSRGSFLGVPPGEGMWKKIMKQIWNNWKSPRESACQILGMRIDFEQSYGVRGPSDPPTSAVPPASPPSPGLKIGQISVSVRPSSPPSYGVLKFWTIKYHSYPWAVEDNSIVAAKIVHCAVWPVSWLVHYIVILFS